MTLRSDSADALVLVFRVGECRDLVMVRQQGIQEADQQVLMRLFTKQLFEAEISERVAVDVLHASYL
jgi:hypothetical protein